MINQECAHNNADDARILPEILLYFFHLLLFFIFIISAIYNVQRITMIPIGKAAHHSHQAMNNTATMMDTMADSSFNYFYYF